MADGSNTTVRIFCDPSQLATPGEDKSRLASGKGASDGTKPLVILWPGWAMGARYYQPFAKELANRGFAIALGELHGQGESTAVASRNSGWGYHDAASQDYPRTIQAVKQRLGLAEDYPTVLLCHSMGGQMGSLFLARPEAKQLGVLGMFGVGAGSPFYKGFSGKARCRLFAGSFIMRWVAKAVGYQPEGVLDVAGYGRQARTHVVEWTHFARRNSLANLQGQDIDYVSALRDVTLPVLLARFSNDEDCSLQSAQNLADAMPNAQAVVEEIPASLGELGHNRWAREPKTISDRFESWVQQIL